jgi:hypothetical protein
MTGERALTNSKAENVQLTVEGSGTVPVRAPIESGANETATIQFVSVFSSPDAVGPHAVLMSIPAVGAFDDVLFVTKN